MRCLLPEICGDLSPTSKSTSNFSSYKPLTLHKPITTNQETTLKTVTTTNRQKSRTMSARRPASSNRSGGIVGASSAPNSK